VGKFPDLQDHPPREVFRCCKQMTMGSLASLACMLLFLAPATWGANPSVGTRNGNIVLSVDASANVMLERMSADGRTVVAAASPILSLADVQALINTSISRAVAPLIARISTLELNFAVDQGAQISIASNMAVDRSLALAAVLTEAGRASAAEAAVSSAVVLQGLQITASTANIASAVVSDRARAAIVSTSSVLAFWQAPSLL
jgi:hypothetical protein